jgi:phosphatidate phosphatase LPIN
MKLGDTGEAFFIEEIEDVECPVPNHLATSPLPDESDLQYISDQIAKLKLEDNNNISSTETLTNNIITKPIIIEANNQQKSETICDKNESTAFSDETSLSSVPKSSSVPTDFLVPNDVNEERVHFSLTPPINKNVECIPNNHFIPINDKRLESTIATQTDENSKEFNGIPISAPNSQQKRIRRKKKSSVIRKQKLKLKENAEQPLDNNQVVKDEEIFKMDDDLESDSISDKFSSSVPILDDLSPTKSHLLNQYSTSFHDFHPYSDSETTEPFLSPNQKSYNRQSSRPSSPDYKSDTEYEIQKHDGTSQTDVEPKVSWQWGELPVVPRITTDDINLNMTSPTIKSDEIVSSDDEIEPQSKKNNRNSMLGGVLNFMKQNKNHVISNANEDKGIYLDELNPNDINPEVAALYFPKFRSHYPLKRNIDDDSESGNGPSLPHSPQSLEVLPSSGPQSIDSGDSDQERSALCTSYDLYAINKTYHDLSMSLCGGLEELHRDSVNSERFLHSIISFDDFSENPTLILQNPNLVIRMGGKYYNWQTAAPIIISLLMFQRQLPDKTLASLNDQFVLKKEDKKQLESSTRSSWWSWRRSNNVSGTNNKLSSNLQTPSPTEDQSVMTESSSSTTLVQSDSFTDKLNEPIDTVSSVNEDNSNLSSASDAEENPDEKRLSANGQIPKRKTKYRKKLRLSSDEIMNLNLHEGSNEVLFSVTTAYQGTTTCKCHIYLWRYDDRIIISDIDGTITKSDVLGHILPIIGKDWAQSGVANLFTKIKKNGYKFLYLSARAIGQARVTREYLRSIRQGDICLPDGPLLLSPTSLMSALHRFKIQTFNLIILY